MAALGTKYQQYDEYKDSGVEWLGEIPSHWEVVPIKHLAILNPKKSTLSQDLMSDECSFVPMEKLKFNSLVLDEKKVIKDVYDGYTYFENEDILVAKVTPCFENNNTTIAKDLINGVGFGSSEIFVLRVNDKVNNRYLFYRLLETIFISVATAAMTGAGGLRRVPAETINTYPIAVPDINEQAQIANFLDHETAQIDTLIEKQKTLIQLLKEKRQAVISHAVTKGLNPDVPMKDSGVEWLGEVPEHWRVCSLKHIKAKQSNAFVDGPFGSNLKSIHFVDGGDVFVIESNFATTGIVDESKLKTITLNHFNTISRSEAKAGDIIIAKIGARFGMSSILPKLTKRSVVSGNSLKLTLDSDICNTEYIKFLLQHLKNEGAMDDSVNVTAQPALSLGGLNNLPVLLPPYSEQNAVIEDLHRLLYKLSDLTNHAEQAIQLMQERRTALISAAVTGKIDVRGWVAPDVDSLE